MNEEEQLAGEIEKSELEKKAQEETVNKNVSTPDAADAEIRAETEVGYNGILWSDDPSAAWPPIDVTANATYYLVISAGSQSAAMSANHYRCGIHRNIP